MSISANRLTKNNDLSSKVMGKYNLYPALKAGV